MREKLKEKIVKIYGSQAEFSMQVPEDESVISRVILGRRDLNPERQSIWAKALGCKVSEIFSNEQR